MKTKLILAGIALSLVVVNARADDPCAKKINDGAAYQKCRVDLIDARMKVTEKQRLKDMKNDPPIGMSYSDVVENLSGGKMLVCNSTKTRGGEHLQCWYPERFRLDGNRAPTMYFDNDILTAVQNH